MISGFSGIFIEENSKLVMITQTFKLFPFDFSKEEMISSKF